MKAILCYYNDVIHRAGLQEYYALFNSFYTEYSDKGEELPLGPSFQHLVSLYLVKLVLILTILCFKCLLFIFTSYFSPSAGETSVRVKKEVENLLRQLESVNASSLQCVYIFIYEIFCTV